MNELIDSLRTRLAQLFAQATKQANANALSKMPFEMDERTKTACDTLVYAIQEGVKGNFAKDTAYALPDDNFLSDMRIALAYRPFVTNEKWRVAENITDEAILSAQKDILLGRLKKLENFRDQGDRCAFSMPVTDSYYLFKMLLNNLHYLLVVLSHQAKRYGSFAAARAFLSAASLMHRRSQMSPPYFEESHISDLVNWIEEGSDELQIAYDYAKMEDWDAYSARESVRFAAAVKEAEAQEKAVPK